MPLARSFFTDIDRVFDDMTRGVAGTGVGFGAVDADYDTDSGRIRARFDLPGVDRDSLNVRVAGDALVIEATRQGLQLGKRHKVLAAERTSGQIRRVFRTGLNLDAESVQAGFEDGVLEVTADTRTPGRQVQVSFTDRSGHTEIGSAEDSSDRPA